MHTFGLEYLNGLFHRDAILTLRSIFVALHRDSCRQAEKIVLQQRFLSVVSLERSRDVVPVYTAPSGMAFIYCDYAGGRYLLLDRNGVMELVRDDLICEGELGIQNVRWMEQDRLVIFDIVYIVHLEAKQCVCHFSGDGNAFVVRSGTRKINRNDFFGNARALEEETIWICSKCAAANRMGDRVCTSCGAPRSW